MDCSSLEKSEMDVEVVKDSRPLITFALFAFNHENYIREAVEGALAQTYSPLEVILSDDFSTDATFRIMQQVVANYHGPHRVILKQNPKNLGLVPHINEVCCNLSQGDLIVVAAGDDISLPERTEKLWRAWEGSLRAAKLITSGMVFIDKAGETIGELFPPMPGFHKDNVLDIILNPNGNFYGATALYHQDIFKVFGPLTVAMVEDGPLSIRGQILGPAVALMDLLVKKRLTNANMGGRGNPDYKRIARNSNRWRISIYDQVFLDFSNNIFIKSLPDNELSYLIKQCKMHRRKHEDLLAMIEDDNFFVRFVKWLSLIRIVTIVQSIDNLVYLIPASFYPRIMKYGLPTDSGLWKFICGCKSKGFALIYRAFKYK